MDEKQPSTSSQQYCGTLNMFSFPAILLTVLVTFKGLIKTLTTGEETPDLRDLGPNEHFKHNFKNVPKESSCFCFLCVLVILEASTG